MHGGDGDALEGRAVQRAGRNDLAVLDEHGGEVYACVVIQSAEAQKRLQFLQSLAAHGPSAFQVHFDPFTPIFLFEYSRVRRKSKEIIVVKNAILLYNIRGMI